MRERIQGTVLAVLRIDRDGRVAGAFAQQVNLRAVGAEGQMARWRRMLAQGALPSLRHWTFRVPAQDLPATRYWYVCVPVSFVLHPAGAPAEDAYGTWQAYVPGPVRTAPWPADAAGAAGLATAPDALPGEGVFPLAQPLVLRAPPGPA